MIEFSRRNQENPTSTCVLPIEKVGEINFFVVDERLLQILNVENPDEWLDFESDGDLLMFIVQHGGIVV